MWNSSYARRAEPLFADSITTLSAADTGRVVVTGSHGGRIAALYAARHNVRAVIFNDACRGMDAAGIDGLSLLQDLGVAAAAVNGRYARIGHARSTWCDGIISTANDAARAQGVREGMPALSATSLLERAPLAAPTDLDAVENRVLIKGGEPSIWALDSASLVVPGDRGAVLCIGSHGGLVGGRPETALKVAAYAAVFSDAGFGPNRAGVSRLPVLDARGIAAATVDVHSARIGDGLSTYTDGIISAVNECAMRIGARIGMPARDFALHAQAERIRLWRKAPRVQHHKFNPNFLGSEL